MNNIKKGNLLIVDDEEQLLKRLASILEAYVENIFFATSVDNGLKILDDETIHCIISDIIMPQKSGVDFIKEVRQRKIEIPFIFFTGHGNHDLLQEAVKYGAFDFLNKPHFDDLEEVVLRGLKKGLNQGTSKKEDNLYNDFINDYQKILHEHDD